MALTGPMAWRDDIAAVSEDDPALTRLVLGFELQQRVSGSLVMYRLVVSGSVVLEAIFALNSLVQKRFCRFETLCERWFTSLVTALTPWSLGRVTKVQDR